MSSGAKSITFMGRLVWDRPDTFVRYKGRPRNILPRIIPCDIHGVKIGRPMDYLYLLGLFHRESVFKTRH